MFVSIVAVVLSTTDVAFKVGAKAASGGPPAPRLVCQQESEGLIMDDLQRRADASYCVSGTLHETVIVFGGCGQELYPPVVQQNRLRVAKGRTKGNALIFRLLLATHARPSL